MNGRGKREGKSGIERGRKRERYAGNESSVRRNGRGAILVEVEDFGG